MPSARASFISAALILGRDASEVASHGSSAPGAFSRAPTTTDGIANSAAVFWYAEA